MTSNRKRYCVLTTQRSGSTWFMELLQGHPDLRAFGEIFLIEENPPPNPVPEFVPDPLFAEFRNSPEGRRRPFCVGRYLMQVEGTAEPDQMVGFKLTYDRLLAYPELAAYLVAWRFRIIHLVRENLLDNALSRAALLKTGLAHRTDRSSASEPLAVDVTEVIGQMKRLKRNVALGAAIVRALPIPALTVSYEALLADPQGLYDRIADFLEIARAPVPATRLKRLSRKPRHRRIANYPELRNALTGTPFEHFVE